jgi:hypothetical protein
MQTMAKPLGPKSRLIRDAIKAHPKMGNTALAKLLNGSHARKEDKIEVTASDVNQQKQAMKSLAKGPKAKAAGGTEKAPKKSAEKPSAAPAPKKGGTTPADLLDNVYLLARQCGGVNELKRLVERLAQG